MQLKTLKLITIKSLFLLSMFLPNFAYGNTIYNNNSNEKNKIDPSYIRNLPSIESYILGIGDRINLKVFSGEVEAINQSFNIDGEGLANLTRLKRIYVKGLSIAELTDILNEEYKIYVKDVDVALSISAYRPIRVYIDGEVENPGMYVLPGSSSPLSDIENFDNDNVEVSDNLMENNVTNLSNNNYYFPSVFDVIRKSSGISMFADLSDVEITRINTISNGGGRIKTKINLLNALNLQDISQNIRLFDGDTIMIPRSDTTAPKQISKAIKSNLNPKFINIFIQGRVNSPGLVKVSKTTSLNEALIIGGGTKAIKGPVVFLRYLNNGEIDRRKFKLKTKAKRGSFNNPYLQGGDVIFVGKNSLTLANEVITEVTNPFQGIFSTWGFFKLLF